MNGTVLLRLSLAKRFLNRANDEVMRGSDNLILASAIVDIHDSIDNLLGAISSVFNIYKDEQYLIGRFGLINTEYQKRYGKTLSNRSEIELLNSMRNNIKHKGILPNITQTVALIKELDTFCNTVTKQIFGTSLKEINLLNQITNEKKRESLKNIEQLILKNDFKGALEKSAYVLFTYFDSHANNLSPLFIALLPKLAEKINVFPDRDPTKISVDLLKWNIDPYLYYRFNNLVPKIGYNNLKDRKYIIEYSSLSWHSRNWTEENARFCLDFLTKLFLSQQR